MWNLGAVARRQGEKLLSAAGYRQLLSLIKMFRDSVKLKAQGFSSVMRHRLPSLVIESLFMRRECHQSIKHKQLSCCRCARSRNQDKFSARASAALYSTSSSYEKWMQVLAIAWPVTHRAPVIGRKRESWQNGLGEGVIEGRASTFRGFCVLIPGFDSQIQGKLSYFEALIDTTHSMTWAKQFRENLTLSGN